MTTEWKACTDPEEVQQVEWGFEKNNPRHIKCGPLYSPNGLD